MSNFDIEYDANKRLTIITPQPYNTNMNRLIRITTSEYDVNKHTVVTTSYDEICMFCHSCDKTMAISNDGGSISYCGSCNLKFYPPKILYVKFRDDR
jgi:hypothetical protein